MRNSQTTLDSPALANENTAFKVLGAIGFSHLLNDMIQSLLPAIYPLLKSSFSLSFTQIGLITLTFQITASLLQPLVGLYGKEGTFVQSVHKFVIRSSTSGFLPEATKRVTQSTCTGSEINVHTGNDAD